MLAPPFIVTDEYGTRCSTVLTIDHYGGARFVERRFDSSGRLTGESDEAFTLA